MRNKFVLILAALFFVGSAVVGCGEANELQNQDEEEEGCSDDTDCTEGDLGVCNDDAQCVECVGDSHCDDGVCGDDAQCVECADDGDCDDGVCGGDAQCVECVGDGDCDDGVCGGDAQCVECVGDGDCDDGVCDDAQCVGCVDDGDCGDNVCSVDDQCVECVNDGHCTGDDICEDNFCGECLAPHGTYHQEVIDAGGNCASGFVDEIAGERDIEIEEDSEQRECGNNTLVSADTEAGCTTTFTLSYRATQDGFEDIEMNVSIACDDGSSCSHDFNAYRDLR